MRNIIKQHELNKVKKANGFYDCTCDACKKNFETVSVLRKYCADCKIEGADKLYRRMLKNDEA